MADRTGILTAHSPTDDVADAELGDSRRTKRFVHIVEAMTHRPDRTVPETFDEASAQEGYYRFIANPAVVELSARSADQASKIHPARRARKAKVKVRCATVEIRRPDSVPADSAPDRIEVNVVEVRAISPPTGEAPKRYCAPWRPQRSLPIIF